MFFSLNLVNPVYASVFAGAYLLFIVAASVTWSSPVLPQLANITTTPFDQPITTIQGSWISSLVLLGATIGPTIFTLLSDVIGRKNTLLSMGVPLCLSYILMASVRRAEAFYVARFLLGLPLGGAFAVFTMYVGEIASKNNRGSMSSIMSCIVNLGFLFPYVIGPWIAVTTFNIILAVMPLGFLGLFFLFGEETAHFWMVKGEEAKAMAVLKRIRPSGEDVEKEMLDIKQKIQEQSGGTVLDVMRSMSFIRSFLVAVGLLIFQPFTGICAVLMYGQTIFYMTGSTLEPAICAIILGLVQFFSSLSTPVLADKLGRRTMLMASAAGMAVFEIPLGVYCYFSEHGADLSSWSFFPIVALTLFLLSYNNGFGPLPWVILGEVFPTRVKTIAFSIITTINWGMGFFITKYFTYFVDQIGLGGAFWVFGLCSFSAILFVYFFLFETRGKTLEEIQDDLKI
ncbi:unnamed protein product [Phaedon cochleariae]|uniref:Major facilitator superfamily (MFS) profile domain-containing protein n=1 Tax=Phaedon cochleariae TaxID=80249 RepID=A0A9P0DVW5_PHACE|nr:unnamed protein product [Phaedon cochleariae]